MPRFDLPILTFLAVVSLGGCATPQSAVRPCPSFGILHDAENLTVFTSGGQDAANLVYRVTLNNAALSCSYHGVKSTRESAPLREPGTQDYAPPTMGPGSQIIGPVPGATATCQSDEEPRDSKRNYGHVSGTLKFDISILRGAAIADTTVTVPYFVAVTRGKKLILARQEFTETVKISGQGASERVEVPLDIPLARGTTGGSYEVIVGLSLTPEQLAYNRKQFAR